EEKTKTSNYSKEKRACLQMNLEDLKSKNKQILKLKLKDLNQKREILTKQFEKNFIETSSEIPKNFPKELEIYWKQKEWDTISKMLNAKKRTIKEHESYLTRELGKKGKTLEWFMNEVKDE